MKYKIGRNQKCICGKNVKYKYCCLKKYGHQSLSKIFDEYMKLQPIYSNNRDVVNRLKRTDISFDDYFDGNEILLMRETKKLPIEIREKVKNLLDTKIFFEKVCWFNTATISLEINGVEKVDGWYGYKFNRKVPKNIRERYVSEHTVINDYGNGYKLVENPIGWDELWYIKNDSLNPIQFVRHSWNRYNGIDFDISVELVRKNWKDNGKDSLFEWVRYREFDTHKNLSDLDTEITNSILDIHHSPIYHTVGNVRRLN